MGGATGHIFSGVIADRPAFGMADRYFWATDEHILYQDTGAAWVKVAAADYPDLDSIPASFTPSAHKATHEDTGGDEINVAGLLGETAELTTHKADVANPHSVSAAQAVADVAGAAAAVQDNLDTHEGLPNIHHAKTTLFTDLTDRFTLAQAHRGADGKILLFQGAGADPIEQVNAGCLTVSIFRINAGTGTSIDPENINDGDTSGPVNMFGAVDKYTEVLFPDQKLIKQFRQFGDAAHTGDGVWKIQYLDSESVWQDWVIGISVRDSSDWGNWDSSGAMVATTGIRLVCTTRDSEGNNYIRELEVKY